MYNTTTNLGDFSLPKGFALRGFNAFQQYLSKFYSSQSPPPFHAQNIDDYISNHVGSTYNEVQYKMHSAALAIKSIMNESQGTGLGTSPSSTSFMGVSFQNNSFLHGNEDMDMSNDEIHDLFSQFNPFLSSAVPASSSTDLPLFISASDASASIPTLHDSLSSSATISPVVSPKSPTKSSSPIHNHICSVKYTSKLSHVLFISHDFTTITVFDSVPQQKDFSSHQLAGLTSFFNSQLSQASFVQNTSQSDIIGHHENSPHVLHSVPNDQSPGAQSARELYNVYTSRHESALQILSNFFTTPNIPQMLCFSTRRPFTLYSPYATSQSSSLALDVDNVTITFADFLTFEQHQWTFRSSTPHASCFHDIFLDADHLASFHEAIENTTRLLIVLSNGIFLLFEYHPLTMSWVQLLATTSHAQTDATIRTMYDSISRYLRGQESAPLLSNSTAASLLGAATGPSLIANISASRLFNRSMSGLASLTNLLIGSQSSLRSMSHSNITSSLANSLQASSFLVSSTSSQLLTTIDSAQSPFAQNTSGLEYTVFSSIVTPIQCVLTSLSVAHTMPVLTTAASRQQQYSSLTQLLSNDISWSFGLLPNAAASKDSSSGTAHSLMVSLHALFSTSIASASFNAPAVAAASSSATSSAVVANHVHNPFPGQHTSPATLSSFHPPPPLLFHLHQMLTATPQVVSADLPGSMESSLSHFLPLPIFRQYFLHKSTPCIIDAPVTSNIFDAPPQSTLGIDEQVLISIQILNLFLTLQKRTMLRLLCHLRIEMNRVYEQCLLAYKWFVWDQYYWNFHLEPLSQLRKGSMDNNISAMYLDDDHTRIQPYFISQQADSDLLDTIKNKSLAADASVGQAHAVGLPTTSEEVQPAFSMNPSIIDPDNDISEDHPVSGSEVTPDDVSDEQSSPPVKSRFYHKFSQAFASKPTAPMLSEEFTFPALANDTDVFESKIADLPMKKPSRSYLRQLLRTYLHICEVYNLLLSIYGPTYTPFDTLSVLQLDALNSGNDSKYSSKRTFLRSSASTTLLSEKSRRKPSRTLRYYRSVLDQYFDAVQTHPRVYIDPSDAVHLMFSLEKLLNCTTQSSALTHLTYIYSNPCPQNTLLSINPQKLYINELVITLHRKVNHVSFLPAPSTTERNDTDLSTLIWEEKWHSQIEYIPVCPQVVFEQFDPSHDVLEEDSTAAASNREDIQIADIFASLEKYRRQHRARINPLLALANASNSKDSAKQQSTQDLNDDDELVDEELYENLNEFTQDDAGDTIWIGDVDMFANAHTNLLPPSSLTAFQSLYEGNNHQHHHQHHQHHNNTSPSDDSTPGSSFSAPMPTLAEFRAALPTIPLFSFVDHIFEAAPQLCSSTSYMDILALRYKDVPPIDLAQIRGVLCDVIAATPLLIQQLARLRDSDTFNTPVHTLVVDHNEFFQRHEIGSDSTAQNDISLHITPHAASYVPLRLTSAKEPPVSAQVRVTSPMFIVPRLRGALIPLFKHNIVMTCILSPKIPPRNDRQMLQSGRMLYPLPKLPTVTTPFSLLDQWQSPSFPIDVSLSPLISDPALAASLSSSSSPLGAAVQPPSPQYFDVQSYLGLGPLLEHQPVALNMRGHPVLPQSLAAPLSLRVADSATADSFKPPSALQNALDSALSSHHIDSIRRSLASHKPVSSHVGAFLTNATHELVDPEFIHQCTQVTGGCSPHNNSHPPQSDASFPLASADLRTLPGPLRCPDYVIDVTENVLDAAGCSFLPPFVLKCTHSQSSTKMSLELLQHSDAVASQNDIESCFVRWVQSTLEGMFNRVFAKQSDSLSPEAFRSQCEQLFRSGIHLDNIPYLDQPHHVDNFLPSTSVPPQEQLPANRFQPTSVTHQPILSTSINRLEPLRDGIVAHVTHQCILPPLRIAQHLAVDIVLEYNGQRYDAAGASTAPVISIPLTIFFYLDSSLSHALFTTLRRIFHHQNESSGAPVPNPISSEPANNNTPSAGPLLQQLLLESLVTPQNREESGDNSTPDVLSFTDIIYIPSSCVISHMSQQFAQCISQSDYQVAMQARGAFIRTVLGEDAFILSDSALVDSTNDPPAEPTISSTQDLSDLSASPSSPQPAVTSFTRPSSVSLHQPTPAQDLNDSEDEDFDEFESTLNISRSPFLGVFTPSVDSVRLLALLEAVPSKKALSFGLQLIIHEVSLLSSQATFKPGALPPHILTSCVSLRSLLLHEHETTRVANLASLAQWSAAHPQNPSRYPLCTSSTSSSTCVEHTALESTRVVYMPCYKPDASSNLVSSLFVSQSPSQISQSLFGLVPSAVMPFTIVYNPIFVLTTSELLPPTRSPALQPSSRLSGEHTVSSIYHQNVLSGAFSSLCTDSSSFLSASRDGIGQVFPPITPLPPLYDVNLGLTPDTLLHMLVHSNISSFLHSNVAAFEHSDPITQVPQASISFNSLLIGSANDATASPQPALPTLSSSLSHLFPANALLRFGSDLPIHRPRLLPNALLVTLSHVILAQARSKWIACLAPSFTDALLRIAAQHQVIPTRANIHPQQLWSILLTIAHHPTIKASPQNSPQQQGVSALTEMTDQLYPSLFRALFAIPLAFTALMQSHTYELAVAALHPQSLQHSVSVSTSSQTISVMTTRPTVVFPPNDDIVLCTQQQPVTVIDNVIYHFGEDSLFSFPASNLSLAPLPIYDNSASFGEYSPLISNRMQSPTPSRRFSSRIDHITTRHSNPSSILASSLGRVLPPLQFNALSSSHSSAAILCSSCLSCGNRITPAVAHSLTPVDFLLFNPLAYKYAKIVILHEVLANLHQVKLLENNLKSGHHHAVNSSTKTTSESKNESQPASNDKDETPHAAMVQPTIPSYIKWNQHSFLARGPDGVLLTHGGKFTPTFLGTAVDSTFSMVGESPDSIADDLQLALSIEMANGATPEQQRGFRAKTRRFFHRAREVLTVGHNIPRGNMHVAQDGSTDKDPVANPADPPPAVDEEGNPLQSLDGWMDDTEQNDDDHPVKKTSKLVIPGPSAEMPKTLSSPATTAASQDHTDAEMAPITENDDVTETEPQPQEVDLSTLQQHLPTRVSVVRHAELYSILPLEDKELVDLYGVDLSSFDLVPALLSLRNPLANRAAYETYMQQAAMERNIFLDNPFSDSPQQALVESPAPDSANLQHLYSDRNMLPIAVPSLVCSTCLARFVSEVGFLLPHEFHPEQTEKQNESAIILSSRAFAILAQAPLPPPLFPSDQVSALGSDNDNNEDPPVLDVTESPKLEIQVDDDIPELQTTEDSNSPPLESLEDTPATTDDEEPSSETAGLSLWQRLLWARTSVPSEQTEDEEDGVDDADEDEDPDSTHSSTPSPDGDVLSLASLLAASTDSPPVVEKALALIPEQQRGQRTPALAQSPLDHNGVVDYVPQHVQSVQLYPRLAQQLWNTSSQAEVTTFTKLSCVTLSRMRVPQFYVASADRCDEVDQEEHIQLANSDVDQDLAHEHATGLVSAANLTLSALSQWSLHQQSGRAIQREDSSHPFPFFNVAKPSHEKEHPFHFLLSESAFAALPYQLLSTLLFSQDSNTPIQSENSDTPVSLRVDDHFVVFSALPAHSLLSSHVFSSLALPKGQDYPQQHQQSKHIASQDDITSWWNQACSAAYHALLTTVRAEDASGEDDNTAMSPAINLFAPSSDLRVGGGPSRQSKLAFGDSDDDHESNCDGEADETQFVLPPSHQVSGSTFTTVDRHQDDAHITPSQLATSTVSTLLSYLSSSHRDSLAAFSPGIVSLSNRALPRAPGNGYLALPLLSPLSLFRSEQPALRSISPVLSFSPSPVPSVAPVTMVSVFSLRSGLLLEQSVLTSSHSAQDVLSSSLRASSSSRRSTMTARATSFSIHSSPLSPSPLAPASFSSQSQSSFFGAATLQLASTQARPPPPFYLRAFHRPLSSLAFVPKAFHARLLAPVPYPTVSATTAGNAASSRMDPALLLSRALLQIYRWDCQVGAPLGPAPCPQSAPWRHSSVAPPIVAALRQSSRQMHAVLLHEPCFGSSVTSHVLLRAITEAYTFILATLLIPLRSDAKLRSQLASFGTFITAPSLHIDRISPIIAVARALSFSIALLQHTEPFLSLQHATGVRLCCYFLGILRSIAIASSPNPKLHSFSLNMWQVASAATQSPSGSRGLDNHHDHDEMMLPYHILYVAYELLQKIMISAPFYQAEIRNTFVTILNQTAVSALHQEHTQQTTRPQFKLFGATSRKPLDTVAALRASAASHLGGVSKPSQPNASSAGNSHRKSTRSNLRKSSNFSNAFHSLPPDVFSLLPYSILLTLARQDYTTITGSFFSSGATTNRSKLGLGIYQSLSDASLPLVSTSLPMNTSSVSLVGSTPSKKSGFLPSSVSHSGSFSMTWAASTSTTGRLADTTPLTASLPSSIDLLSPSDVMPTQYKRYSRTSGLGSPAPDSPFDPFTTSSSHPALELMPDVINPLFDSQIAMDFSELVPMMVSGFSNLSQLVPLLEHLTSLIHIYVAPLPASFSQKYLHNVPTVSRALLQSLGISTSSHPIEDSEGVEPSSPLPQNEEDSSSHHHPTTSLNFRTIDDVQVMILDIIGHVSQAIRSGTQFVSSQSPIEAQSFDFVLPIMYRCPATEYWNNFHLAALTVPTANIFAPKRVEAQSGSFEQSSPDVHTAQLPGESLNVSTAYRETVTRGRAVLCLASKILAFLHQLLALATTFTNWPQQAVARQPPSDIADPSSTSHPPFKTKQGNSSSSSDPFSCFLAQDSIHVLLYCLFTGNASPLFPNTNPISSSPLSSAVSNSRLHDLLTQCAHALSFPSIDSQSLIPTVSSSHPNAPLRLFVSLLSYHNSYHCHGASPTSTISSDLFFHAFRPSISALVRSPHVVQQLFQCCGLPFHILEGMATIYHDAALHNEDSSQSQAGRQKKRQMYSQRPITGMEASHLVSQSSLLPNMDNSLAAPFFDLSSILLPAVLPPGESDHRLLLAQGLSEHDLSLLSNHNMILTSNQLRSIATALNLPAYIINLADPHETVLLAPYTTFNPDDINFQSHMTRYRYIQDFVQHFLHYVPLHLIVSNQQNASAPASSLSASLRAKNVSSQTSKSNPTTRASFGPEVRSANQQQQQQQHTRLISPDTQLPRQSHTTSSSSKWQNSTTSSLLLLLFHAVQHQAAPLLPFFTLLTQWLQHEFQLLVLTDLLVGAPLHTSRTTQSTALANSIHSQANAATATPFAPSHREFLVYAALPSTVHQCFDWSEFEAMQLMQQELIYSLYFQQGRKQEMDNYCPQFSYLAQQDNGSMRPSSTSAERRNDESASITSSSFSRLDDGEIEFSHLGSARNQSPLLAPGLLDSPSQLSYSRVSGTLVIPPVDAFMLPPDCDEYQPSLESSQSFSQLGAQDSPTYHNDNGHHNRWDSPESEHHRTNKEFSSRHQSFSQRRSPSQSRWGSRSHLRGSLVSGHRRRERHATPPPELDIDLNDDDAPLIALAYSAATSSEYFIFVNPWISAINTFSSYRRAKSSSGSGDARELAQNDSTAQSAKPLSSSTLSDHPVVSVNPPLTPASSFARPIDRIQMSLHLSIAHSTAQYKPIIQSIVLHPQFKQYYALLHAILSVRSQLNDFLRSCPHTVQELIIATNTPALPLGPSPTAQAPQWTLLSAFTQTTTPITQGYSLDSTPVLENPSILLRSMRDTPILSLFPPKAFNGLIHQLQNGLHRTEHSSEDHPLASTRLGDSTNYLGYTIGPKTTHSLLPSHDVTDSSNSALGFDADFIDRETLRRTVQQTTLLKYITMTKNRLPAPSSIIIAHCQAFVSAMWQPYLTTSANSLHVSAAISATLGSSAGPFAVEPASSLFSSTPLSSVSPYLIASASPFWTSMSSACDDLSARFEGYLLTSSSQSPSSTQPYPFYASQVSSGLNSSSSKAAQFEAILTTRLNLQALVHNHFQTVQMSLLMCHLAGDFMAMMQLLTANAFALRQHIAHHWDHISSALHKFKLASEALLEAASPNQVCPQYRDVFIQYQTQWQALDRSVGATFRDPCGGFISSLLSSREFVSILFARSIDSVSQLPPSQPQRTFSVGDMIQLRAASLRIGVLTAMVVEYEQTIVFLLHHVFHLAANILSLAHFNNSLALLRLELVDSIRSFSSTIAEEFAQNAATSSISTTTAAPAQRHRQRGEQQQKHQSSPSFKARQIPPLSPATRHRQYRDRAPPHASAGMATYHASARTGGSNILSDASSGQSGDGSPSQLAGVQESSTVDLAPLDDAVAHPTSSFVVRLSDSTADDAPVLSFGSSPQQQHQHSHVISSPPQPHTHVSGPHTPALPRGSSFVGQLPQIENAPIDSSDIPVVPTPTTSHHVQSSALPVLVFNHLQPADVQFLAIQSLLMFLLPYDIFEMDEMDLISGGLSFIPSVFSLSWPITASSSGENNDIDAASVIPSSPHDPALTSLALPAGVDAHRFHHAAVVQALLQHYRTCWSDLHLFSTSSSSASSPSAGAATQPAKQPTASPLSVTGNAAAAVSPSTLKTSTPWYLFGLPKQHHNEFPDAVTMLWDEQLRDRLLPQSFLQQMRANGTGSDPRDTNSSDMDSSSHHYTTNNTFNLLQSLIEAEQPIVLQAAAAAAAPTPPPVSTASSPHHLTDLESPLQWNTEESNSEGFSLIHNAHAQSNGGNQRQPNVASLPVQHAPSATSSTTSSVSTSKSKTSTLTKTQGPRQPRNTNTKSHRSTSSTTVHNEKVSHAARVISSAVATTSTILPSIETFYAVQPTLFPWNPALSTLPTLHSFKAMAMASAPPSNEGNHSALEVYYKAMKASCVSENSSKTCSASSTSQPASSIAELMHSVTVSSNNVFFSQHPFPPQLRRIVELFHNLQSLALNYAQASTILTTPTSQTASSSPPSWVHNPLFISRIASSMAQLQSTWSTFSDENWTSMHSGHFTPGSNALQLSPGHLPFDYHITLNDQQSSSHNGPTWLDLLSCFPSLIPQ